MDSPRSVLGLDLSLTSTGVVLFTPHGIDSHTIIYKGQPEDMLWTEGGKKSKPMQTRLSGKQKIERLLFISDEIVRGAQDNEVSAVGIEGYAYSRHSSSVTGLAELGGVVRARLLAECGIPALTVTIGSARKFVMGKAAVKKADAQKYINEHIQYDFNSEDEKDAYFIASALYHVINGSERRNLRLDQLEFLDDFSRTLKKQTGTNF